jgi:CBS domain-containing protein
MADTVRDVMMPEPLTVDSRNTVQEAAQMMRENDIGDVLVTEEGQLRGILTDRDIVVRAIAAERHPAATPVGDCCSTEVQVVQAGDTPDQAAEVMRQHALRRLPVVDEGRVVGIVSIGDLAVAEDPTSTLADISAAQPNV